MSCTPPCTRMLLRTVKFFFWNLVVRNFCTYKNYCWYKTNFVPTIVLYRLVAPADRNSGYSESDPKFPDILARILYRSEGKNYKLGLSACRIYTETDRNFRRCRNLLSMYRCNFVHTNITNSLLIENFERRNLFFCCTLFYVSFILQCNVERIPPLTVLILRTYFTHLF